MRWTELRARERPAGAEAMRRAWQEGQPRSVSASLVCTLAAADGRTLGSLAVEVGPPEAYGVDQRVELLRQGAANLAEVIPAVAAAPEGRWEDRGKSSRELAIHAVLVQDGEVLEERDFRLPVGRDEDHQRVCAPLAELVATYERKLIEEALRSTYGNRARAARILQTTERILGYRIQQYGIDCARFRRERR